MTRTLRLSRETLTELATDDLRVVHGASGVTCYCVWSENLRSCAVVTEVVTIVTTAVVTPSCP